MQNEQKAHRKIQIKIPIDKNSPLSLQGLRLYNIKPSQEPYPNIMQFLHFSTDTCCLKAPQQILFDCIDSKHIKNKLPMRQQSQSQHQSLSNYTNESTESRKQRMDKKRAIRKNKVGFTCEETPQTKEDKKFLTKEQKMQIQKAKNRQAAQKSRDQHKKFVDDLVDENRRLKEQLAKPRYCHKCSKEVLSQTEDSSDPSMMTYPNDIHLDSFIQNQNNQEPDEFESPFIRMNDYEDSSPLKMFLLIAMVMLGLFLMGGSGQGTNVEGITVGKRDLMEVNVQNNGQQERGQVLENSLIQTMNEENKRFKQIQEISRFDLQNQIVNSFNMEDDLVGDKIMTEVMPLSYQLSPLSQQNCIKSIIEHNYTEITKVTYTHPTKITSKSSSLRSNYLNQMELFSSSAKDSENNLLFCSLPKLYRKTQEVGSNLFSKFIDIVISGSEMMEILGKSPNVWMNKMVNFNGIYKINAEVKEIVQIQDGNCIL